MDTIPFPEETKDSPKTAMRAHILLSGVIDIYHRWHIGKLPWTLEELTAEIEKMILEWTKYSR